MDKYYRIAGLTVKMDMFGAAECTARPYEITEPKHVDIEIVADWKSLKEKYPTDSDTMCNYVATCKKFYRALIDFNGMQVHSSALVINGKAYLFSANPGTGKSTHVTLWRRVFGDERVRVLNDDKPAIRYEEGKWYAYGTPWSGKTTQNLNLKMPLGGICFLERGETNEIERYKDKDLVFQFLNQTVRPEDPDRQILLLSYIENIIANVPIWKLKCNMEPEAAIVAYEAKTEKK